MKTLEYKEQESETGCGQRSLLKIIWKWFIGCTLYTQWFLLLLLSFSITREDSNLLWAKGKWWSIAREGRNNILEVGVWGTHSSLMVFSVLDLTGPIWKRKCQKLKQTSISEERMVIGQEFSLLRLVIHRFHRIIKFLNGFGWEEP